MRLSDARLGLVAMSVHTSAGTCRVMFPSPAGVMVPL